MFIHGHHEIIPSFSCPKIHAITTHAHFTHSTLQSDAVLSFQSNVILAVCRYRTRRAFEFVKNKRRNSAVSMLSQPVGYAYNSSPRVRTLITYASSRLWDMGRGNTKT